MQIPPINLQPPMEGLQPMPLVGTEIMQIQLTAQALVNSSKMRNLNGPQVLPLIQGKSEALMFFIGPIGGNTQLNFENRFMPAVKGFCTDSSAKTLQPLTQAAMLLQNDKNLRDLTPPAAKQATLEALIYFIHDKKTAGDSEQSGFLSTLSNLGGAADKTTASALQVIAHHAEHGRKDLVSQEIDGLINYLQDNP